MSYHMIKSVNVYDFSPRKSNLSFGNPRRSTSTQILSVRSKSPNLLPQSVLNSNPDQAKPNKTLEPPPPPIPPTTELPVTKVPSPAAQPPELPPPETPLPPLPPRQPLNKLSNNENKNKSSSGNESNQIPPTNKPNQNVKPKSSVRHSTPLHSNRSSSQSKSKTKPSKSDFSSKPKVPNRGTQTPLGIPRQRSSGADKPLKWKTPVRVVKSNKSQDNTVSSSASSVLYIYPSNIIISKHDNNARASRPSNESRKKSKSLLNPKRRTTAESKKPSTESNKNTTKLSKSSAVKSPKPSAVNPIPSSKSDLVIIPEPVPDSQKSRPPKKKTAQRKQTRTPNSSSSTEIKNRTKPLQNPYENTWKPSRSSNVKPIRSTTSGSFIPGRDFDAPKPRSPKEETKKTKTPKISNPGTGHSVEIKKPTRPKQDTKKITGKLLTLSKTSVNSKPSSTIVTKTKAQPVKDSNKNALKPSKPPKIVFPSKPGPTIEIKTSTHTVQDSNKNASKYSRPIAVSLSVTVSSHSDLSGPKPVPNSDAQTPPRLSKEETKKPNTPVIPKPGPTVPVETKKPTRELQNSKEINSKPSKPLVLKPIVSQSLLFAPKPGVQTSSKTTPKKSVKSLIPKSKPLLPAKQISMEFVVSGQKSPSFGTPKPKPNEKPKPLRNDPKHKDVSKEQRAKSDRVVAFTLGMLEKTIQDAKSKTESSTHITTIEKEGSKSKKENIALLLKDKGKLPLQDDKNNNNMIVNQFEVVKKSSKSNTGKSSQKKTPASVGKGPKSSANENLETKSTRSVVLTPRDRSQKNSKKSKELQSTKRTVVTNEAKSATVDDANSQTEERHLTTIESPITEKTSESKPNTKDAPTSPSPSPCPAMPCNCACIVQIPCLPHFTDQQDHCCCCDDFSQNNHNNRNNDQNNADDRKSQNNRDSDLNNRQSYRNSENDLNDRNSRNNHNNDPNGRNSSYNHNEDPNYRSFNTNDRNCNCNCRYCFIRERNFFNNDCNCHCNGASFYNNNRNGFNNNRNFNNNDRNSLSNNRYCHCSQNNAYSNNVPDTRNYNNSRKNSNNSNDSNNYNRERYSDHVEPTDNEQYRSPAPAHTPHPSMATGQHKPSHSRFHSTAGIHGDTESILSDLSPPPREEKSGPPNFVKPMDKISVDLDDLPSNHSPSEGSQKSGTDTVHDEPLHDSVKDDKPPSEKKKLSHPPISGHPDHAHKQPTCREICSQKAHHHCECKCHHHYQRECDSSDSSSSETDCCGKSKRYRDRCEKKKSNPCCRSKKRIKKKKIKKRKTCEQICLPIPIPCYYNVDMDSNAAAFMTPFATAPGPCTLPNPGAMFPNGPQPPTQPLQWQIPGTNQPSPFPSFGQPQLAPPFPVQWPTLPAPPPPYPPL